MKITDKQRIDFVQRHRCIIRWFYLTGIWAICIDINGKLGIVKARTWRQAVDKAIKVFQKGSK
jgi:hypothetical protein